MAYSTRLKLAKGFANWAFLTGVNEEVAQQLLRSRRQRVNRDRVPVLKEQPDGRSDLTARRIELRNTFYQRSCHCLAVAHVTKEPRGLIHTFIVRSIDMFRRSG